MHIDIRPGEAILEASAGSARARPIAAIVAEVDAALGGQSTTSVAPDLVATSLDERKIWANYNKPKQAPRRG